MALARIQNAIVNHLVELGVMSAEAAQVLRDQPEDLTGEAVDKLLQKEHKVTTFQLLLAKSKAVDLPLINPRRVIVDERTFKKLEPAFCRDKKVLPIGECGGFVLVAVANPFDMSVRTEIERICRGPVCFYLGGEAEIKKSLDSKSEERVSVGFEDVVEALGMDEIDEVELDQNLSDNESAPIIQLANRIVEDAYYAGASDIHIEPMEKETRVRERIDGVLEHKLSLPANAANSLIARFKIMAQLDIAEKRLPQDGRIVFKQYTKKAIDIDLRVSTAPLNFGEGIVMRLLDKQKSTLPLPALGFSEDNLKQYRKLIERPYGMILHCGPTGSGKSMTLYSALNEVNSPEICIRTAEDPIEYTLPGLCQMQMQRRIGLTFANALRAFLRQDPDVILVGEIRDKETAQIAVEAALTGHLLFSTLHTNDAPTTISRLTEMDIEPFMISASLICVCAQRLIRRVCRECGQAYMPTGNEAEILDRAIGWTGRIKQANGEGCPVCNGNGYKGRVGIHELMAVSEELVAAINERVETVQLKKIAMRNGMVTLHQDSLLKVMEGITTMAEALGTVPPDMEAYETRYIAKRPKPKTTNIN
jgi:type IV pilus assembly protein PilB